MLIRPRPGFDRDQLLEALIEVGQKAAEVRGEPGSVFDRYNRYIAWTIEAVRRLRHMVGDEELDSLILTRRYWLLQSLPNDHNALRDVIDLELQERCLVIDGAVDTLRRQVLHWQGQAGVFVVADTNVYIHDPARIEDIPWRDHLGLRSEPVHVLVPMVVVDELDRLKDSSNATTRWRAGLSLAVMDRVLHDRAAGVLTAAGEFVQGGAPAPGEVTIEIVVDPPGHTRLPLADDEIVDRALAIRALANRPVIVATYDTGMSTRARYAGMTCVKLAMPIGNEPGLK